MQALAFVDPSFALFFIISISFDKITTGLTPNVNVLIVLIASYKFVSYTLVLSNWKIPKPTFPCPVPIKEDANQYLVLNNNLYSKSVVAIPFCVPEDVSVKVTGYFHWFFHHFSMYPH